MKKLFTLLLLGSALVMTSCGSSSKTDDTTSVESVDYSNASLEVNGDSDSGKAGALRTVYFAFNSSGLSSSTKATLEANADFLKGNTSVEVQVEGHADERGGREYNMALGENRARAIKNYLVALGVDASRISTTSYGKERPISFGHNEDSWSQNRRGNFVIIAK
ncbi:peptidoglycan-associated lipoprotein Pal [Halobacteriovorax sp. XZX-3]|uniref:peptidoglycan-associated lipoprotein Pal n=1 Tax=unclassified Halobacteriovorax TaxID=2639665 RepID=UPI000CD30D4B|nr:peptidoglycan-associated lipoprotein Pal [Halobacteriovorax sp. DA5]POB12515.1 peptidoglycan-associated lipoprotein [Halobacteriovorax sp. DA5]